MTYPELDKLLQGRNRHSRKLANNTYAERHEEDVITVRLHNTDILKFGPDGLISLNSGGWLTVTTKARLNDYLPWPWRIWSVKGVWTVYDQSKAPNAEPICQYADGMTINAKTGKIRGGRSVFASESENRYNLGINRLINRYIKGLTAAKLAEVMSQDGQGDCLFCRPFDFGDSDHLLSHLRERYYMPHLIMNVIRSRKYRMPKMIYGLWLADAKGESYGHIPHVNPELPRLMRKYFRDRLFKGPRQGKVTGAQTYFGPISQFA